MTNDTKNLLMQYLYRIADHYQVQDAHSFTFKKRADLMDKLKATDSTAWAVMNNLIEAFIKSDRIQNDKEKYDKARILWDGENTEALKEKVHAEMNLVKFCKENGIAMGQILAEN